MKVFLVQPPLWTRSPSIGLAQLGAYLKSVGHEVQVFDANLGLYLRSPAAEAHQWEAGLSGHWLDREWVSKFLDRHARFLADEYLRPIASAGRCAVGLSVNAASFQASLLLAERVKAANPGARVILGGQYLTIDRWAVETALAAGNVDAVVVGDGEHTTAELLRLWGEGRDVSSCKGAWTCQGSRAHFAGPRKPIDLDSLPFADYTLFPLELYENYDSRCILLMTSRGCVRNCMFCGYRVPWPGLRVMSGDRIYAEIEHQRSVFPKAQGIYFYDLLVNGDMP
ncbi:MAG: cobalamin-dependent protein, partial [Cyanobacteria bacterium REEB65]|nr:cobalamin-dependent protein [Cyanobacteria bacterium REEB65]